MCFRGSVSRRKHENRGILALVSQYVTQTREIV